MKEAHAIVGATGGSLFHTTATLDAIQAGARFVSVTEASEELLASAGMMADFGAARPLLDALRDRLTAADELRITAPGGTDIHMSLRNREGMIITALAREAGTRTAAPDLEAFIAPVEGTAEGVLVPDVSASGVGLLSESLHIPLREGRAVELSGGDAARQIASRLAGADDDAVYVVAELGIGANPSATARGSIVEDEGVYGTAHVALGDNRHFSGGQNTAPLHIDFVLREPSIWLDDVPIMTDGRLREDAGLVFQGWATYESGQT
jgi:leucyl aminopeptidase (aminopeptidase T)